MVITRLPATDERAARLSGPSAPSKIVALEGHRAQHHSGTWQIALVDNLANAAIAVACCAGLSVLGSVWAMSNPNEDNTR
ncbi:hypothetical protein DN069_14005 [Streptacidiphilus pinicola]|uniref:Uncharacterized protein n=1 Tax=Streptacidiphilus pinicola TaxID=2219663 RepID=A0A2X0IK87_9ACTN|nr:hypothetical protein [Streptacidiphilus pinicola]RAG85067.1 hypothetical protein DN069_14005 [Streptacidiphilus pinicola]